MKLNNITSISVTIWVEIKMFTTQSIWKTEVLWNSIKERDFSIIEVGEEGEEDLLSSYY